MRNSSGIEVRLTSVRRRRLDTIFGLIAVLSVLGNLVLNPIGCVFWASLALFLVTVIGRFSPGIPRRKQESALRVITTCERRGRCPECGRLIPPGVAH